MSGPPFPGRASRIGKRVHDFKPEDAPEPPPDKESGEDGAVKDSSDQKGQPSKDG